MIVILGGTREGRELFTLLQNYALPCIICVVSDYGKHVFDDSTSSVYSGSLNSQEMAKLLKKKESKFLVDATHPFAVKASENAIKASQKVGTTYIRLEREREQLPRHELVKTIEDFKELDDYLQEGKVVFSAVGSKTLDKLVSISREKKCRLVVRIPPFISALEKCSELGIAAENLVIIQGPCSRELNRELYKHFGADLVLTKESGKIGGQEAKVLAAIDLGVEIVLWRRPKLSYPLLFNSTKKLCDYLLESIPGR